MNKTSGSSIKWSPDNPVKSRSGGVEMWSISTSSWSILPRRSSGPFWSSEDRSACILDRQKRHAAMCAWRRKISSSQKLHGLSAAGPGHKCATSRSISRSLKWIFWASASCENQSLSISRLFCEPMILPLATIFLFINILLKIRPEYAGTLCSLSAFSFLHYTILS